MNQIAKKEGVAYCGPVPLISSDIAVLQGVVAEKGTIPPQEQRPPYRLFLTRQRIGWPSAKDPKQPNSKLGENSRCSFSRNPCRAWAYGFQSQTKTANPSLYSKALFSRRGIAGREAALRERANARRGIENE